MHNRPHRNKTTKNFIFNEYNNEIVPIKKYSEPNIKQAVTTSHIKNKINENKKSNFIENCKDLVNLAVSSSNIPENKYAEEKADLIKQIISKDPQFNKRKLLIVDTKEDNYNKAISGLSSKTNKTLRLMKDSGELDSSYSEGSNFEN